MAGGRWQVMLVAALVGICSAAWGEVSYYGWLEAEDFLIDGTELPGNGHPYWAPEQFKSFPGFRIAGPGVVAEWSQGGESEWNSLGIGPDETGGVVSHPVELPRDGAYRVWVRYSDYQLRDERFTVVVRQGDSVLLQQEFGAEPAVQERDEFKQYWGKVFAWGHADASLPAGPLVIEIRIDKASAAPRQIDCLLITDDMAYRPRGREKPGFAYMQFLDEVRERGLPQSGLCLSDEPWCTGKSWKREPLAGHDFLMAYNMPDSFWQQDTNLAPDQKVLYPYSVPRELVEMFEKQYAGQKVVPIFDSPLITPVFYITWLDKWLTPGAPCYEWVVETKTPFTVLVNYGNPSWDNASADALYRVFSDTLKDQWIGFISGEALPYFPARSVPAHKLRAEPETPEEKADLERLKAVSEMRKEYGLTNRELNTFRGESRPAHARRTGELVKKQLGLGMRSDFGTVPVDDPIAKSISCMSSEHTVYSHLLREWGARIVGSEHSAVMPNYGMRLAFQRGAARQYGGWWAYYHAPNFGDTATTFGAHGAPTYYYWYVSRYGPEGGPSITWYRKCMFHQYMSGMSLLYYEQGGDQFFQPKPGQHGVELDPIGKVTDEFLTFAETHPDRGVTVTPVAVLLDINHGWGLTRYHAGYMRGAFPETEADRAIRGLFDILYYPHPRTEGEPATGDRQAFVSSMFGEIFDVLVTSPTHREAIQDYATVIASGDIAWSKPWTAELEKYVNNGGTLVLDAAQLAGPWSRGFLGVTPLAETRMCEDGMVSVPIEGRSLSGVPFAYQPVKVLDGSDVLARTSGDDPVVVRHKVGKGQVIIMGIPYGLGMNDRPHPVMAWLMTKVSTGLLPIRVEGNVQYLVNRNSDGWVVTLINNEGLYKPQLGLSRIDRTQSVEVILRTKLPVKQSTEWITGRKIAWQKSGETYTTQRSIPVCGIEIIELAVP